MTIPYDAFTGAFLGKISEYDFLQMNDEDRQDAVDGYMKRVMSNSLFKKVCKYDFIGCADDETRVFTLSIDEGDVDELIELVADGMLIQWMKPYVYQQELLHNQMNTRDYSVYSPAELLMRIGNAYAKAQKDFTYALREYSFNHADLSTLHL